MPIEDDRLRVVSGRAAGSKRVCRRLLPAITNQAKLNQRDWLGILFLHISEYMKARKIIFSFNFSMASSCLCLLLLVSMPVAGCARGPHLKPAPEAQQLFGDKKGAFVEAFGVRVIARGRAWSGNPPNLEEILTPIQITLQNRSGRAIRVEYHQFVLVGATGIHSPPLPPDQIEPIEAVPALSPPGVSDFSHQRFYVAPYQPPFLGRNVIPWSDPFAIDPVYYRQYAALWPFRLPTEAMFRKALPEGVLQDGGRFSGFLYFQKPGKEISRVRLTAELVDAKSGGTLGMVSIPFLVK